MFQFQKTQDMLPSELMHYIAQLELEVRQQQGTIDSLSKPDIFVNMGDSGVHLNEQDLLDSLDLGEVAHVKGMKQMRETFKVKISPERIDDYASRIEAEHARMLHNL